MTQEPTIQSLAKAIEDIRRDQLESEKCAQRTIQQLQQQIDECVKQIRTLKTEIQVLHENLRKR